MLFCCEARFSSHSQFPNATSITTPNKAQIKLHLHRNTIFPARQLSLHSHFVSFAMSKAPAAWSLRYKSPADFPNIAKFGDDLDWNGAHKPLQMYFKEEELKDDDVVPIEKDSEYYRRKRERRRNYRKKNTLVLEDSAPPEESTGFRFEGKMCNLGLADIEDAKTKAAEVKEAPFRYVLLQFVKKENER